MRSRCFSTCSVFPPEHGISLGRLRSSIRYKLNYLHPGYADTRMSAFMFCYRTHVLGEDRARAEVDLHRIWKPFGAWTDFIERPAP